MSKQYVCCLDNELRLSARELTFGHELPCGAYGAIQFMRKAQIMAKPNHDAQRQFIPKERSYGRQSTCFLSKAFAVQTVNLCEKLRERKKATVIINQLLRSGTSISAIIHEANYASSKADFINKFQIALKECYETDYWLDIFHEA